MKSTVLLRASAGAALGVALAGVAALAACSGGSKDDSSCSIDPGIDAKTCSTLLDMQLADAIPASPTNAHADDYNAALMGFLIFFDARFSSTHTVRCQTCHAPETYFDDESPVATGVEGGVRNAPTVLNAAWMTRSFFWDGRVDVLWAPPIAAMENPKEMNLTRLELAHTIATYYSDQYQALYGTLPDLSDTTRFPPVGKPGDPAFDGMAPADQDAVNRLASNVGKSLEAYLRKLATGKSPFDRFLAGDKTQMTTRQELGMLLFVDNGCANCHSGPLLTDDKFHNLGVPATDGGVPDPGRSPAVAEEQTQMFSPSSEFADQPQAPLEIPDATPADLGAFRTPPLRNVALTDPYMHNGAFTSLSDAVQFHLQGGGSGNTGYVGTVDPLLTPRTVSSDDLAAIVDFLSTLNGDYPAKPWNNWPDTP
jgi:cytochrome c peroxidase